MAKNSREPDQAGAGGPNAQTDDDRASADRARRFRRNFVSLLQQRGMTVKQLSEKTGVSLQTLRYWKRSGIAFSRDERLDAACKALGVADPQSMFEANLETAQPTPRPNPSPFLQSATGRKVDRQTNPMVEEVKSDRPELFQGFEEADWDELYSLHGTGGALTYDGVCEAATDINRKRELRRKFDALLETEHFETLASLIDVLYRDTSL